MRKILTILSLLFAGTCLAQTTMSGTASASGTALLQNVGSAVSLVSISVSPPNPVISYTSSQQFSALGTYNNMSTGDVTGTATWSSSNSSIATSQGMGLFQCVTRGTITVSASLSGVTGTTTLQCQSPTFTPQGIINVTQQSSSETIVQFTASGASPFTFSGSGLPGFLSLSNSGCPGTQVNCSLVGTPATLGVYNFYIQVTDTNGNTACASPGCAVGVNVVPAGNEDNTYCSLVSGIETVIGSPSDPPANPMINCNYTAIASTTGDYIGSSPTIINVCPVGQLNSGVSVTGCANAPQPTLGGNPPSCYTTGGIYCSTIQSAVNYAYNSLSSPCGADIQLWPRIDEAVLTSSQNVYTEPNVVPPGNVNCGPDYGNVGIYIRTKDYASLPPPGNRISPSWYGTTSIPNYPNFAQTTDFGISPGIYMPQWRCEYTAGALCQAIDSQMTSTHGSTTGQIWSGLRIMGIQFTAPHGRNTSTDLYGNNICPLNDNNTPQCSPGWVGGLIELGCVELQNNNCNQASGTQGNPAAAPSGTGGQHDILDRVVVMGCDDDTMTTCYDSAETLVIMVNGQHLSTIDSYIIGGYCINGVGECVEGKGIAGGNPTENLNDLGIKVVDDFIAGSSENTFWGGGAANNNQSDVEIRRNHMFKPLTWKADSSVFVGEVYDGWVNKEGSGLYSSGTTCSIDPPLSGTQATCNIIIGTGAQAGLVLDITITNHGSGYGLRTKARGTTYPARPNVYLTDGGVTYTSCQNQLGGQVNTNGTTTVTWSSDNKFIPGLVGTQITINGTNYLVTGFTSNTIITVSTNVPPGTGLTYASNFPTRGDCVYLINGTPNVKNLSEFKNGVRVIWEGNIMENVWIGQSDQDGPGMIIQPRNANNLCPTCSVTDFTLRYNLIRNMAKGFELGDAFATQGGALPLALERISIHDNVLDGMDAVYWTAGTSGIPANPGTCNYIGNYQGQTYAPQSITFNHNTCIVTAPNGYNLTGGAHLALFYWPQGNGPSIMPNIVDENSIGAGGAKVTAAHSTGQANCQNQSCFDQAGHGPTEVALRQQLVNSFLGPISTGAYTTNELNTITLTGAGTCTSPPTSATLSGGGGTGGTAAITTTATGVARIWPVTVGQGYTSAPTVVFNGGTCSVAPTATAEIVGVGLASGTAGCFDHNIMPLQAWAGIIPMTPYPTAQIDTTNSCASASGGHNNTVAGGTTGYNVCNGVTGSAGSGPCVWEDLKFVNFVRDGNNAELVGTTPDLHFLSSSLGYQAGNDGLDIGANVTLVLGCQSGASPGCSSNTTSQYTGITISGGVAVLPQ